MTPKVVNGIKIKSLLLGKVLPAREMFMKQDGDYSLDEGQIKKTLSYIYIYIVYKQKEHKYYK